MLAQRPVKLFLLFVLIVGFFPVIGWAGGPILLTDEDMDGIYAKGPVMKWEGNIVPWGNSPSLPSITLPDISMPGNVGGISGGNTSANAGQTTPSTASEANTGSPVNAVHDFYYPGVGVQISDNAMQGNSGMIINAPNSAISISVNVVVLNNSTVAGDILQSSNSYPTNAFFSFKNYMK